MTWPSTATKVNLDASGDDPKLARAELVSLIDKFNQLQAHVTAFAQGLLDDATAATALATLTAAGTGVANTFTADQTITSTDAGAGAGPLVILHRDSATPAAADGLGQLRFNGEDSASNAETYARVRAAIVDPTSTSEDGLLHLGTVLAGAITDRLSIGAGIYTTGAAGGDMGANTINATTLYQGGVAVSTSSGKIAQIVESTTSADFSITATITVDATIPQITEGTEILTRTVTPTNASSTFLVEAEIQCAPSTADAPLVFAMFTDAVANAFVAVENTSPNASVTVSACLSHILPAFGDTSLHTIRLRGAVASGTMYVNRHATTANVFDTAMITRLRVTEILP